MFLVNRQQRQVRFVISPTRPEINVDAEVEAVFPTRVASLIFTPQRIINRNHFSRPGRDSEIQFSRSRARSSESRELRFANHPGPHHVSPPPDRLVKCSFFRRRAGGLPRNYAFPPPALPPHHHRREYIYVPNYLIKIHLAARAVSRVLSEPLCKHSGVKRA